MKTAAARIVLTVVALCLIGTTSAFAAKVGVQLGGVIPTPTITDAAPHHTCCGTLPASNAIDSNDLTQYASAAQGINTFIEFDFGASTGMTHFRHQGRGAADGIVESQLTFSDTPGVFSGPSVATVVIPHTDQVNSTTYDLGGTYSGQYVQWKVNSISGGSLNQGAFEMAFLNMSGRYAQIADPAITAASTAYPGLPAGNVLDNNLGTQYASYAQGAATFIDFEFDQPTQISGFEHANRSGHVLEIITESDLIFSNDPTFAPENIIDTVTIEHQLQQSPVLYAFPEQTAQYVRWDVTGIDPAGGAGYQGAREIGFYQEVPDDHVALDAPTITAGSPAYGAADVWSGTYSGNNLFDGDETTQYASWREGTDTYLELDLGQVESLVGVEHIGRGPADSSMVTSQLIVSMDSTFDALDPVITLNHVGSAAYQTFAAVSGRYVRWEVHEMTTEAAGDMGGREMIFYVPEPCTLLMAGLGGLMLFGSRLRRRRA